jgi:hypothetical protein
MICLNCQDAAKANRLSLDIAMAEQFRQQQRMEAQNLHTMCERNSCFCQHRIGDDNIYWKSQK